MKKTAQFPELSSKALSALMAGGGDSARPVLGDLPGAGAAFLATQCWKQSDGCWLWIVQSAPALDELYMDTVALVEKSEDIVRFPAWESLPSDSQPPTRELTADRLQTLSKALSSSHLLVLTSIQALMQHILSPAQFSTHRICIQHMLDYDPEHMAITLDKAGYQFEIEVSEPGQAARRGSLLDVWPPTQPLPVRIDFFDTVVDSIRSFDPVSQQSVHKLSELDIPPASDWHLSRSPGTQNSLLDFLPDSLSWCFLHPEAIGHHAERFAELVRETQAESSVRSFTDIQAQSERAGVILQIGPGSSAPIKPSPAMPAPTGTAMHPDLLAEQRTAFIEQDVIQAAKQSDVHLFLDTTGSMSRFSEMFPKARKHPRIHLHQAAISQGFMIPEARLRVFSEQDLFGYTRQRRPQRKTKKKQSVGTRLDSWTALEPGELVIHVDHGLGRYLGLFEIDFKKEKQEVLAVEYAKGARLYVPVAHTHLLSRYIGVGKRQPELHTLGGKRWQNQRAGAEQSIQDMAVDLLETQAARNILRGHAFAADQSWQHEFENAFPYTETEDQVEAILQVKQDMESNRPMDRLICGDVGYGKTEVAMRAAFKAVMDGKQVAVLVPTTVLAQQHWRTFSERMAAFPITIEMLSRFRTRGQQNRILQNLQQGSVDIVIGTHRLVQPDVAFKDLGLVIIDEEQRFGVAHKEQLKQLRSLVDVLTLTATPIPRTLYMSLTGARDMSTIQTPPQERQPVETRVCEYSDDLVRHAIRQELNRDGQVFYLHNRVQSIRNVEKHLKELLPEARIGVAHGQMSEKTLSSVMQKFVDGKLDVLLCTTIIESGMDIPNVNTILIDRADRFGMADLYQLRGRVGRYHHQAYAYLLLPRHGRLFDTARKRIGAIQRYSALGAGFKLALRDLEIRGAGNLLGAQQSGHIAAIGFELYCQLLRRTVAQLNGERIPPIVDVELRLDFIQLAPAQSNAPNAVCLPYGYVEDESLRVNLYRRIATAATDDDVTRLRNELADRFGPLPDAADRLLLLTRLRTLAARHDIRRIETQDTKLIMIRHEDYIMPNRRFPRLSQQGCTERLEEIIHQIEQLS